MRRLPVLLVAASLLLAAPFSSSIAGVPDKASKAINKGDFKTAVNEMRPAAENGDRDSQFMMGMFYDAGKGVAQDPAAAASWYRKAAEQDHLPAQLFLGVLYHNGEGVKQDYTEAARWFRAPADSGIAPAQFYLGWMYAVGNGVEKDSTEAINWLAKAAAQGNTRAMGMLATELFSRHRDDQDLVDAYAWSHLAAELDPIQAMTSARGVIEQYCDGEQIKRGKATMAEWKRKWSSEAKVRSSGKK